MPQPRIAIPEDAVREVCRRRKIVQLAVFGSARRDDFGPDSDVDVLVKFAPDHGWSLFDRVPMEDELGGILGRKVDLVSRDGIERSRNYIRRNEILRSAQVFYEAA